VVSIKVKCRLTILSHPSCAQLFREDMSGIGISVAMCTFNGRRFLGAQLDSIAAQQRPPDELVVCDDGSSDGSIEIVRAFAQRAPFPTRLVVNDRNLGSTKNFEQAISLCQGAIVALADQDDVWYRHKLERIEKAFLKSSEIVAAFSDADLIDNDSNPLGLRLWPALLFDGREQSRFSNGNALGVLIKHPVVTGATMAFRRELFEPMVPIPKDEIHDKWISFLLAARGEAFEVISEPLMQYRRYQEQQIGPGPLSVQRRVAQARDRGADFHREVIAQLRQLHARLESRRADFRLAEAAQTEIERKISHLEHRAGLPGARLARVPRVLREAFNGGYQRYSSGWNSVVKDLVVR
jgi:glycosyltransferase involved in cell wall biosynthesis